MNEFSFAVEGTLPVIVLLPLLGALLNAVGGAKNSRSTVTAVAVGSVAAAFLVSLLPFYALLSAGETGTQVITTDVYEWFSITVGDTTVPIHVRFVMDHLSGIMTVMVTGIATLIHVYSIGYMEEDPGFNRFMTYLNLFTASMLILVLASNIVFMFVGWEGVGLCSYLLIGFWYKNKDYAAAGRKAFVVNRIGDFGVLVGMFLLVTAVAAAGSVDAFEFSEINAAAVRLGYSDVNLGAASLPISVATAAALFLFIGCTGKSAQLPLFVWLPDAMAGPTPVSALIHAATMVTAGIYLLCRLSPVVVQSPLAMSIIAIVGASTALMAASIALVQNQMKKILAYSTVSQLGFMFAAVGMGAFAGGFFHVFTHAFFKACLFLGAGSVMHAVHAHGDADIRYLGGLKRYMPKTHLTFMLSCGAIAGLPLLSGFFSKDEILLGATTWAMTSEFAPWVGWLVFGMLVVAATMTAFYMFRLYFLAFHGEFKGGHPPAEDGHGDEHSTAEHSTPEHTVPHESPDAMTIPLIVLATGAVLVGFLGLPHLLHLPNWWGGWLTPQYEAFLHQIHEGADVSAAMEHARHVHASVAALQFNNQLVHAPPLAAILAMGFGTAAGLGGTGLAYLWYMKENGETPAAIAKNSAKLHSFLMDKWRVDEFYGVIIVAPMKWVAVFSANVDRFFIDGLLTRASAALMQGLGYAVTRLQNGQLHAYTVLFVTGLVGLGWWFSYPHAQLEGEAELGQITWSASPGLAYEYRWDFDSDGEWDTEWGLERETSHHYDSEFYYGLIAVVESGPRQPSQLDVLMDREREVELAVDPGAGAIMISEDLLGFGWSGAPEEGAEDPLPPALSYDEGAMRVHINGANIPDRDGGDDGTFMLNPGETLTIGQTRIHVAVRMRGTLQVRNAFGNLSRESQDVTLMVAPNHAALGQHHSNDLLAASSTREETP